MIYLTVLAKDSSNEVKRIRNPLTWYRTQKKREDSYMDVSYMRKVWKCTPRIWSVLTTFVTVETHPKGYPQLAAFLNSDEDFAILRRFGTVNCRVLLHLQAEIADLEKQLTDLDDSDAYEGQRHHTGWWLWNMKRGGTRDNEIYSNVCKRNWRYIVIQNQTWHAATLLISGIDDLVFKDTQMRALGKPLKRNHKSLFHWICSAKPVAQGEDDWSWIERILSRFPKLTDSSLH